MGSIRFARAGFAACSEPFAPPMTVSFAAVLEAGLVEAVLVEADLAASDLASLALAAFEPTVRFPRGADWPRGEPALGLFVREANGSYLSGFARPSPAGCRLPDVLVDLRGRVFSGGTH